MLSTGENPLLVLSIQQKIECVRIEQRNTDATYRRGTAAVNSIPTKAEKKGPRTFQRLLELGRGLMRSSILVGDLAHSKGLCCE